MLFMSLLIGLLVLMVAITIFVTLYTVNSPISDTVTSSRYKLGDQIHVLPPQLHFANKYENVNGMPSLQENNNSDNNIRATAGTGLENTAPNIMKNEVAADLTKGVKILLTKFREESIDLWATRSTLLGTLRHQGLVPWHPVVHLGFSHGDLAKVVGMRGELEKDGLWTLEKRPEGYRFYKNGTFSRFPYITLTIFSVREDELALCTPLDELLECSWRDSYLRRTEIFDVSDVFPLGEALFEGMIIKIPKNYDSCLTQLYGEKYNTEVRGVCPVALLNNKKTRNALKRFIGK
jgi:hypothetical protein